MLYLRVKPDQTITYPYNPNELRRDHPDTSFPQVIPDTLGEEYNVFKVEPSERPQVDRTKYVVELDPILIEGVWTQQFEVVDKTQQELEQEYEQQAQSVRSQRNQLLSECDWTQVDDAPVDKVLWASYRNVLREVPSQKGFPWNVEWPTPP